MDVRPYLELIEISKRFSQIVAADCVSMTVIPGQIHALLGENGAGKSTLMKVMYGLLQPDSGQYLWDGEVVNGLTPAKAQFMGMGMVHQHFSLIESLTVTENLMLANAESGRHAKRRLMGRLHATEQRYGLVAPADQPVIQLSVGERQRIEILRCLMQERPLKLLLLDEPTAVLTAEEVDRLFAVLRTLTENGVSIVFVTHKLDEVRRFCDRVTVLRAGKVVADVDNAREVSPTELASWMVGENLCVEECQRIRRPNESDRIPRLKVQNLRRSSTSSDSRDLGPIDFEVFAGEIFGIAGVSGNGQKALMALLSGEMVADQAAMIEYEGTPIGLWPVHKRRRLGLRYVPEDRQGEATVSSLSLLDNFLLTRWPAYVSRGRLRFFQAREKMQQIVRRFQVRGGASNASASTLSGGNLQKFILGREMDANPRLLLVSQPTWGIDVASAQLIHRAMIELCERGGAIVVVSEDLDELLRIADRLVVIHQGQLSPVVDTHQLDRRLVGAWLGGHWAH